MPLVRSASTLALAALLAAPAALAQSTLDEGSREAVLAIEAARGEAARSMAALRAESKASFAAAQTEALATFEAEKEAALADFEAALASARASLEAARADAAARCAESAPDAREACERDETAAARAESLAAVDAARGEAKARIDAARVDFHASLAEASAELRTSFAAQAAELRAAYEPKVKASRDELAARGVSEGAARAALVAARDPAAQAATAGEFKVRAALASACASASPGDALAIDEARSLSQESCAKVLGLTVAAARSEANPVAACAHFLGLVKAGLKHPGDDVSVAGHRLGFDACQRVSEESRASPAGLLATATLRDRCRAFAQEYRQAAALDPLMVASSATYDGVKLTYGACARALDSPESRASLREEARARIAAALAGGDKEALAAAAQDWFSTLSPERQALVRDACARLALSGEPSVTLGDRTLTPQKCDVLGFAGVGL